MNSKLEIFKQNISGKKVAVLGIGISNIPAIEYLVKLGAKVTARDLKEKLDSECNFLKDLGVEFVLGKNYLDNLDKYDYILRSPGVKPFEKGIEDAVKNGVVLTSEIELLVKLCQARIIGVTGSDGKTTTTTLISKFLEEAGYKVWLGGNIGIPLFSKIDEIKKDDIVVLELSSFQLMTMENSPSISVITNISPNHLNYHRDYEEYVRAKENIFLHQNKDDILVLNKDDEFTKRFIKSANSLNIRTFSIIDETCNGVYLNSGNIVSNVAEDKGIISTIKNVKLVGMHNLANICAASSAVIDLVSKEAIRKVISTFAGVEHRMELVRIRNNVKWYNDSIATSPTRTIAGLKSFKQQIILIAGGYDKHISYDVIGKYILEKVKVLILVGDTSRKIKEAVEKEAKIQNIDFTEKIEMVEFDNLKKCVEFADSVASDGDIVAMSPASASFDMYKNFEQRGNYFKELVNNL